MNAMDLFGLVVRLTGFGLIVFGGMYFNSAALQLIDVPGDVPPWMYFRMGVFYFVEGGALILFADWIVRMCFRNNRGLEDPPESENSATNS